MRKHLLEIPALTTYRGGPPGFENQIRHIFRALWASVFALGPSFGASCPHVGASGRSCCVLEHSETDFRAILGRPERPGTSQTSILNEKTMFFLGLLLRPCIYDETVPTLQKHCKNQCETHVGACTLRCKNLEKSRFGRLRRRSLM